MNFFKKSIRWNFLISCILLSSCSNQSQIPFKNIPHIQYFNLNGKVAEMQVEAFQCEMSQDGYTSPNILNIQNFSPISNATLLANYIHKNGIDIFQIPIDNFWMMGNSNAILPMLSNISISFNKQGYISEFSTFWKEKRIQTFKYEYNENEFLKSITQYELFNAFWSMKEWGKSLCEYIEKGDTIQTLFQYEKSKVTRSRTIKQADTTFTNKEIIYTFEKVDRNMTLEKIYYDEKYIDSAHIISDKNKDILKIEYFQDQTKSKKGEIKMLLENNIVYKILPSFSNNTFDSLHRLEEDKDYKYTYDENGLYKTIYDKTNSILSEVYYEMDGQGNWIKMEIVPDRSAFDKVNESIKELEDLFDDEVKLYNSYNNMDYPPFKKMELIIKNLEEINSRIYLLRKEALRKKDHTKKTIVKRNILYY